MALVLSLSGAVAVPIQPTPPMGWMSWQVFRCETDCATHPDSCINDALYRGQADRMAADGYLAAGYSGIHIDDCWPEMQRDSSGRLVPDAARFPAGMKALGDYIHSKDLTFGIYSAAYTSTCAGYPGSYGNEAVDAATFAEWGADYLKYDGCAPSNDNYSTGYHAMGAALQATGRPMVYSCSWPAYLGDNETTKPFAAMIADGCNLWRNWDDIDDTWSSLVSIINHWGDYREALEPWSSPGHFHDPDMLLAGTPGVTLAEAGSQLAVWSISAAPLIMGNDLRSVPRDHLALLLNPMMIAIDQDPRGLMGGRVSPSGDTEIWARSLFDGSVAVALFNKNAAVCSLLPGAPTLVTCAKSLFRSHPRSSSPARACCEDPKCAGVVGGRLHRGGGVCEGEADAVEMVADVVIASRRFAATNITVSFQAVGAPSRVNVMDVWAQRSLGYFSDSFSASVAPHGTAFVRLIPATTA